MKKFIAYSIFLTVSSSCIFAQTSSSSDGDWNTGGNWTAGVPEKDEAVTITNNMDLDTDFEIDVGGDYLVSGGTIIDNGGGYKITHQGTGSFDIGGNVTVNGDYELKNNADLTIRGCDTLRVGGNGIFENNGDLIIEPCGVLIVDGDLTIKNNFNGLVDGQISVGGDLLGENGASLSGDGNIEVAGSVELKNTSNLFGSTTDCGGTCEYGSGAGLPITLKSFNANVLDNNKLKIEWSTAAEINNEFFRIEISADGYEYVILSDISGAGNSQVQNDYAIVRVNPFIGAEKIYIRMTQFDFDGKSKVFNPIVVYLDQNVSNLVFNPSTIVVYPNPNDGQSIHLKLKDLSSRQMILEIVDISGRVVYQENKLISDVSSELSIQVKPGTPLRSGIYLMRVKTSNYEISERFSVNQ